MLHPIADELRLPPVPMIRCDSLGERVVTTRQFEEGIAVANYSACGARLTGNAPIRDAPTVVLLGDSHVLAREVYDQETMGAHLERRARSEGRPLNVRQYGWRGASPAQYVVVANDVLRRWNPARVVVLLAADDFEGDSLQEIRPRLLMSADGAIGVDSTMASRERGGGFEPHALALDALIETRWAQIIARSPPIVRRAIGRVPTGGRPHGRGQPEVAPGVARLLAEQYGDRLLVVYIADVGLTGGEESIATEAALLEACETQGIRCRSTRAAMLDARKRGIAARGFSITVIGQGHLNADGHAIVAREIWQALR